MPQVWTPRGLPSPSSGPTPFPLPLHSGWLTLPKPALPASHAASELTLASAGAQPWQGSPPASLLSPPLSLQLSLPASPDGILMTAFSN